MELQCELRKAERTAGRFVNLMTASEDMGLSGGGIAHFIGLGGVDGHETIPKGCSERQMS